MLLFLPCLCALTSKSSYTCLSYSKECGHPRKTFSFKKRENWRGILILLVRLWAPGAWARVWYTCALHLSRKSTTYVPSGHHVATEARKGPGQEEAQTFRHCSPVAKVEPLHLECNNASASQQLEGKAFEIQQMECSGMTETEHGGKLGAAVLSRPSLSIWLSMCTGERLLADLGNTI